MSVTFRLLEQSIALITITGRTSLDEINGALDKAELDLTDMAVYQMVAIIDVRRFHLLRSLYGETRRRAPVTSQVDTPVAPSAKPDGQPDDPLGVVIIVSRLLYGIAKWLTRFWTDKSAIMIALTLEEALMDAQRLLTDESSGSTGAR